MKQQLVDYIKSNIDEEFEADDDLIDYLDSVSLLQMVVAIEQMFNIRLNMASIDLDNFETVDSLTELLDTQKPVAV
jgi:acyl carrier protein